MLKQIWLHIRFRRFRPIVKLCYSGIVFLVYKYPQYAFSDLGWVHLVTSIVIAFCWHFWELSPEAVSFRLDSVISYTILIYVVIMPLYITVLGLIRAAGITIWDCCSMLVANIWQRFENNVNPVDMFQESIEEVLNEKPKRKAKREQDDETPVSLEYLLRDQQADR